MPGFNLTLGYTLAYLGIVVLIPISTIFFKTFTLVIAPALIPALLTGFALAFARALGEYGSVVFISGNMPMHTEVVPLLIMSKLEQFDYAGATAIAVVMLTVSFVLLLGINMLQRWSSRRLTA